MVPRRFSTVARDRTAHDTHKLISHNARYHTVSTQPMQRPTDLDAFLEFYVVLRDLPGRPT